MKRLILLRHGQSQWNLENRFTGWTDVDLSEAGRQEAAEAGRKLKQAEIYPQIAFTSYLRRAVHTQQIVLSTIERDWIPDIKDWHLNERHYGALQGLNKADTAEKYGEAQVHEWRRSFDVIPPLLTTDDPRYPGHDTRYAHLSQAQLPLAESLRDTIARVKACWEELISPCFVNYDTALITAHGNSLRGLAMTLLNLTASEIVSVEIPTGTPWIFELGDRLNVTESHYL